MKNKVIVALHLFVGIGAIFGGFAAILNPISPLGATTEALRNSPFQDFLIPGILLFVVVGLGNIASAILFRFPTKALGYVSSVVSWALVIWIVVQCVMLQAIAFLHVLFFLIGLVQAVLAASILFERRQFPVNIALALLDKMRVSRRETGA